MEDKGLTRVAGDETCQEICPRSRWEGKQKTSCSQGVTGLAGPLFLCSGNHYSLLMLMGMVQWGGRP